MDGRDEQFLLWTADDNSPGGMSRRDFVRICTMAAAAVGLPASAAWEFASAAQGDARPPVIWLHFQECTGCTETMLRTTHPDIIEVLFELIQLDYHETIQAAAGMQAEQSLHDAMTRNAGAYVLVVEGSIPRREGGIYCKIGGRTAVEVLEETAAGAAAVIAMGSCASFGGISASGPNPTGASGVPPILDGKTVVTIPGCPPNPYNFLGTVLQFATYGTLPALDELGRPLFGYGRTIHEHCPRRPHFDAGRFATTFGDENHRLGYCLYKLGCKGPQTHANCPSEHFGEVPGAWPIGVGHPCVGCTEREIAFQIPIHETVDIDRPTPPDFFPPVERVGGGISATAAGVAGLVGGALAGAGFMASRKLGAAEPGEDTEHPSPGPGTPVESEPAGEEEQPWA